MVDELTVDECWAELAACEVGHIGVISEGEPYVTPVSFVADQPTIAFRTLPGRRLRAMHDGGVVCFEATSAGNGPGSWVSVVAWGTLSDAPDSTRVDEIVSALYEKYHSQKEEPFSFPAPTLVEPEVVVVTIDRITGRSSGKGFGAKLRPGRL